MHLVRSPAHYPTNYQFLCNRISPPMITMHFLTYRCDRAYRDRLRWQNIFQSRVKSLCFGRSLNQNRYRPVSILIQGA
jgi:hypothetical protein